MSSEIECPQDDCDGHLVRLVEAEEEQAVHFEDGGLRYVHVEFRSEGWAKYIECLECHTMYSEDEAKAAAWKRGPDALGPRPDVDLDVSLQGDLAAEALYELIEQSELPGDAPKWRIEPSPDGPVVWKCYDPKDQDGPSVIHWRTAADIIEVATSELTVDLVSRLERVSYVTVHRGVVDG